MQLSADSVSRLIGSTKATVRPNSAARVARVGLVLLVASACSFPDYNFLMPMPAAGAGGGGSGGDTSAPGGAGTGGAGASGNAGVSGNAGAGQGASAGMSGEGGSAGESGGPLSCADYAFFPGDCNCFDNDGHAYLFCFNSRVWAVAESMCEFYSMTLTKIDSPAENAWIQAEALSLTTPLQFQYFWIGGSTVGSPGTWHWPDGTIFWKGGANGTAVKGVYFDWHKDNPQDTGTEACVFMDQDGWQDGDCTSSRSYVCEWQR